MESTPGPWYSTMAPVPPFTVRMPATFKMTSLGEVQPDRVPVSFTPITWEEDIKKYVLVRFRRKEKKQTAVYRRWKARRQWDGVCKLLYSTNLGTLELPRNSCHHVDGVGSSDSDADGTKPTTVWCVGVCADEHHSWVGVVLKDDLLRCEHVTVSITIAV